MMTDAKSLRERYTPQERRIINAACQMTAARFSPCGTYLVAGGFDGRLHRWLAAALDVPEPETGPNGKPKPRPKPQDVPQPEALPPREGHAAWVTAVAFSPSGDVLFSGDSWGRLCAAKLADEMSSLWQQEVAHDGWLRDLAVHPDGTRLASCGRDRAVRLWSAADGTRQRELTGHQDEVFSVAFHPDGRFLVSGDLKGAVRQWDATSGEPVRQFDAGPLFKLDRLQDVGGARLLRFSPDGGTLAVAGTAPKNGGNVQGVPTVLLFDWATGQLRQTLALGTAGDVYVCDLAFHPDGFLMAVTSGNPGQGKLLFQQADQTEPFHVTTHMANCHSLSLHPDGRRLAIAATNRGSNGNGRRLKDGQYPGNFSPIHLFDLPQG